MPFHLAVLPLHFSPAAIIQKPFMLTSTSCTGVDVTFKKIYLRYFSNFYYGEIFGKTFTPIFLDPRESNQT